MNGDDIIEAKKAIAEWAIENFGVEQPAHFPLSGVGEEIGELTTSVLKRAQGIGDAEKYQGRVGDEAEMDAIGDIFIYLMDFIHRSNIDIENVVQELDDHVNVLTGNEGLEHAAEEVGIEPAAMYATFGLYGQYAEVIDAHIMDRHRKAQVVAGIIEFLEAMCDIRGYSFDDSVNSAMNDVLDREWDANVQV